MKFSGHIEALINLCIQHHEYLLRPTATDTEEVYRSKLAEQIRIIEEKEKEIDLMFEGRS
jgi:hypothetical protein